MARDLLETGKRVCVIDPVEWQFQTDSAKNRERRRQLDSDIFDAKKDPLCWSTAEIEFWLCELGFEEYIDQFRILRLTPALLFSIKVADLTGENTLGMPPSHARCLRASIDHLGLKNRGSKGTFCFRLGF